MLYTLSCEFNYISVLLYFLFANFAFCQNLYLCFSFKFYNIIFLYLWLYSKCSLSNLHRKKWMVLNDFWHIILIKFHLCFQYRNLLKFYYMQFYVAFFIILKGIHLILDVFLSIHFFNCLPKIFYVISIYLFFSKNCSVCISCSEFMTIPFDE